MIPKRLRVASVQALPVQQSNCKPLRIGRARSGRQSSRLISVRFELEKQKSFIVGRNAGSVNLKGNRLNMEVRDPLIHHAFHFRSRFDETHEVNRFGSAAHPDRHAVNARLLH